MLRLRFHDLLNDCKTLNVLTMSFIILHTEKLKLQIHEKKIVTKQLWHS